MDKHSQLVQYEQARSALANCVKVDEAKDIKDKAAALALYGKKVKDHQLENWASEIKFRAARRIGQISKELEKVKPGGRGNIALESPPNGLSKKDALAKAGITKQEASRDEQLAAIPEKTFEEIIAEIRAKQKPAYFRPSFAGIIRSMKREKKIEEIENAAKKAAKKSKWRPDVHHCRMEDLLPRIVGLKAIITDPPYPKEFLPLYETLAKSAVKALAHDGLLAVLCGQSYLPEILALMTPHIPYCWTMAYLTPGGQSVQLWDRKVNTFWKPVLIFGKPSRWFGDVAKSDVNDNDKNFHGWGQSESGIEDLVRKLTEAGETVCDPFMGAGTTGVACVRLSRNFVGCDSEKSNVEMASNRMLAMREQCQKTVRITE